MRLPCVAGWTICNVAVCRRSNGREQKAVRGRFQNCLALNSLTLLFHGLGRCRRSGGRGCGGGRSGSGAWLTSLLRRRFLVLLVGTVAADRAADTSADNAVMTGDMTCHAADCSSGQTPFGAGSARKRQCSEDSDRCKSFGFHYSPNHRN